MLACLISMPPPLPSLLDGSLIGCTSCSRWTATPTVSARPRSFRNSFDQIPTKLHKARIACRFETFSCLDIVTGHQMLPPPTQMTKRRGNRILIHPHLLRSGRIFALPDDFILFIDPPDQRLSNLLLKQQRTHRLHYGRLLRSKISSLSLSLFFKMLPHNTSHARRILYIWRQSRNVQVPPNHVASSSSAPVASLFHSTSSLVTSPPMPMDGPKPITRA